MKKIHIIAVVIVAVGIVGGTILYMQNTRDALKSTKNIQLENVADQKIIDKNITGNNSMHSNIALYVEMDDIEELDESLDEELDALSQF